MAKSRAHAGQLSFFDLAPAQVAEPAAMAGAAARTARQVAQILKDDGRDRAVIAAEMSILLDEDVSAAMLDAYASPARTGHTISYHRYKALIIVTKRIDILDLDLRHDIGVAVLDGEDLKLAQLGHIDRQIAALREKRKHLEITAKPKKGVGH